MLILYITYIDFGPAVSGSGVRPQKMYQAFLAEGHQVKLLSGRQGGAASHDPRRRAVGEVSRWLDTHRPDICYVESPYYPILWGFDRALLRKIHRLGIPMGYFYRDFVGKFPGMVPRRPGFKGWLRDRYMAWARRLTERTLRCADIVYLPTREAAALFDFRDMRPLPPGGEDRLGRGVPGEKRCVYVGGVLAHYSGETLLRAFRLLNAGEERYPLTLVCREREWAQIPEELKGGGWLDVRHESGEELVPLLSGAGAGLLIGSADSPYNDYVFSVKTFEYLSYGLPLVYVKTSPLERFNDRARVGLGAEDDPESFAQAVRDLFADRERYEGFRRRARETLLGENLWVHRVRQVVRELGEKREGEK